MKTESTIKKQMSRLRSFINENRIPKNPEIEKLVDHAYSMECALLWVTEDCSWTPINSVKQNYQYIQKHQSTP
jgi:hypothetical protein